LLLYTVILSLTRILHFLCVEYCVCTAPKDSENFVPINYGAERLFSVTEVFVIDCDRTAAIYLSVTKFTNLVCGTLYPGPFP
jgi:hypothetical protein